MGVTERLKIDHSRLAAINPRIITCAISGFGETGPFPDRPAFDLVAQGMGGGMSLTGHADGQPLRAGIPIGDLGGGLFAAIGILSALHARHLTGRGQHIDISMLDAQLSLLNYMGTMYLMSGRSPGRSGNGHFAHVPYDTFRTTTRHLIVAVIADSGWANLVSVLNDDVLRDPAFGVQQGRFASKALIMDRVQAALQKESCEHWLEVLAKAKVPAAPVNELADAFADSQVLARHMRVFLPLDDGGSVEQPGNPVKLSDTREDHFAAPPTLGRDTVAVLSTLLGLDLASIDSLAASGVIGAVS